MEPRIQLRCADQVVRVERRPHALQDLPQLGDQLLGRVLRRVPRCEPLEDHAGLQDLGRLVVVDKSHLGSAMRLVLDEALLHEAHERGADGRARRVQQRNQVRFDEALVGLEPAADDCGPQPLVRFLRARAHAERDVGRPILSGRPSRGPRTAAPVVRSRAERAGRLRRPAPCRSRGSRSAAGCSPTPSSRRSGGTPARSRCACSGPSSACRRATARCRRSPSR